jgi:hypothetical protein
MSQQNSGSLKMKPGLEKWELALVAERWLEMEQWELALAAERWLEMEQWELVLVAERWLEMEQWELALEAERWLEMERWELVPAAVAGRWVTCQSLAYSVVCLIFPPRVRHDGDDLHGLQCQN